MSKQFTLPIKKESFGNPESGLYFFLQEAKKKSTYQFDFGFRSVIAVFPIYFFFLLFSDVIYTNRPGSYSDVIYYFIKIKI